MSVVVHNITDRANTEGDAVAIRVGHKKIRPGKAAMVDESYLGEKVWRMHGSVIWIGPLPARFSRTSKSAIKARGAFSEDDPKLTIDQARTHLSGLEVHDLLDLCTSMVPPLEFANPPPKKVLVARLGRSLFMPDRVLDPEAFYWLRRWDRRANNTYVERE